MIRAVALLAASLLLLGQVARADDRWWGADKAQHLALSAAMASAWYATCSLLGDDPRPVRVAIAATLAFAPGLLKELHDSGRPGKAFSSRDLTWDLIGAAAGSLLGLAIDWLVTRPADRLAPRAPLLWVGAGGLGLRF